MEPFNVQVHPELDEQGAVLPLTGVLDIREYNYGKEVLGLPEGLSYDLLLTNTGEGVLLSGTVHAAVQGSCARCLKTVTEEVEADVEGYYVFEQVEEVDGYATDEFALVDEEGNVDVAGPMEGALVYGTPYIMLCSPDCKGLCPRCGADLNSGPCGCEDEAEAEPEIDPDSPFAVLKDYKFDDSEDSSAADAASRGPAASDGDVLA